MCLTDDPLLGGYSYYSRQNIWKYDANTEKWEEVGQMSEARSDHAVTTVANKDIVKYCNN